MSSRALALGVLLFALPALGQESAADKKLAAEALFAEGRQLMDAGNVEAACEMFERSDALDPAPGTLLNLGECHLKLGRTASAWAAFRRAASAAGARGQTERSNYARGRAGALEPKLARLSILVPDAARVPGLSVRRNGRPLEAPMWGTAVPVDPQRYVIEATAAGRRPWRKEIEVAAGGNERLEIPVLVELEGSSPSPDPGPEPDSGSGRRTLGIVLMGVGGVGLAAGAFFGLRARSQYEDSKQECLPSDPNQCSPEGIEERDSARASGNVATVAAIIGAAALTAGAVVYFTAPSGPERSARGIWLAPEIADRSGGVRLMAVW